MDARPFELMKEGGGLAFSGRGRCGMGKRVGRGDTETRAQFFVTLSKYTFLVIFQHQTNFINLPLHELDCVYGYFEFSEPGIGT